MLTLRLAKPGDGAAVETFLEANKDDAQLGDSFIGVAEVINSGPRPNFHTLVALDGEEVVGALFAGPPAKFLNSNEARLTARAFNAIAERVTEIVWIVVKPSHRRTGIGRALINLAENEARKHASVLLLFFDQTKKHLKTFYEHNSYTIIPEGHGFAVQPPAVVPPIGLIPTFQGAYKMLNHRVSAKEYSNAHVLFGVFD